MTRQVRFHDKSQWIGRKHLQARDLWLPSFLGILEKERFDYPTSVSFGPSQCRDTRKSNTSYLFMRPQDQTLWRHHEFSNGQFSVSSEQQVLK